MKIIWTEQAEKDLEKNLDYLLEEWSKSVTKNFAQLVAKTIVQISNNPYAFQSYESTKIRIVPIVPQITLFYEVDRDKIILLRFWNNSQDPLKRKL